MQSILNSLILIVLAFALTVLLLKLFYQVHEFTFILPGDQP